MMATTLSLTSTTNLRVRRIGKPWEAGIYVDVSLSDGMAEHAKIHEEIKCTRALLHCGFSQTMKPAASVKSQTK